MLWSWLWFGCAVVNLVGAADALNLATDELAVLQDIRRRCNPLPSSAIMATWCIGAPQQNGKCRPNVVTHPCTGRVLSNPSNTDNYALESAEFIVPWWGVVCDPSTFPVAVVELTLPHQGLTCVLESLNFTVFSNLVTLNLEGNAFTGPVPDWVGTMTSLEVLNVNGNQLSGPLPESIIDNVKLEELSLAQNQLTGPVPNMLKVLPVAVLDLFGNQLTGTLPADVLRNPRLRYLDLSENDLFGLLPLSIHLPRIVYFDVSFNRLSGPLPPNLQLLGRDDTVPQSSSVLTLFDASNNLLESAIPGLIGKLERLSTFSVRNNSNIFGKVPPLPPSLLENFDPTTFDGPTHHLACPLPELGPSQTWGPATEIVQEAWLFVAPEPVNAMVVNSFDNRLVTSTDGQLFGGTTSASLYMVLDTTASTLDLLQYIPTYLVVLDMLLDEAAMLLNTDMTSTRLDVLKPLACPTFSMDLTLVCPQAIGRLLWLLFYIFYYINLVWMSHLWLYSNPTRVPPLMESYRSNGGQTVNTAIVFPPPIPISAATLRNDARMQTRDKSCMV
ncbi:hypothetical protein DYB26_002549 [Aphanomyces astaci]|uniref:Leucine-rich repeat-containing N-terminal plant-type domain-containing protein n=1 Tax=Aphanomyces astaci TaxID=112090 RepID=A0A418DAD4_APHAT|nr:hypothetical protein DYB26_002549 [Aphanomyces astaci]